MSATGDSAATSDSATSDSEVMAEPDSITPAVNEETPAPPAPPEKTKLIEIGWIIVNRLEQADWEAIRTVQRNIRSKLEELFPEFVWQMPLVRQEERVVDNRVEPTRLVQQGAAERDSYRLDFALLLTSAELIPHYKPYAMAVVSRTVDVAVLSTGRIDPQADDFSFQKADRIRIMSDRLAVLVLHTLGHLCGLGHRDDPHNFMRDIQNIHELATLKEFAPEQIEEMRETLIDVADERLEEQRGAMKSRWWFRLRSIWINRREIIDAVREAKPWEFPRRLSRLTTAALSSMLILMITAETWDLALKQPIWRVLLLFFVTLIGTTSYVITRQRLLVRRHRRRLSEQMVITNVSTIGIVLFGMMATGGMLFGLTFALGFGLFERSLIQGWAASFPGKIGILEYMRFSTFVSSLGLVVGALGASFEEQAHFRHITYIDEET